jgi:glycosyltransferase involved in cell wall biosynthesis
VKVVHVVPGIGREAAGPSYAVVRLCEALNTKGCEVKLAVLGGEPELELPPFVHQFPVQGFPARLGRSLAMKRWLLDEVGSGTELIHNHFLWKMPSIYAGIAARHRNVPMLLSPHGTLAPWALNQSKWVKKLFWRLKQSEVLSSATCFHATSHQEYLDIRKQGFKQPVCIIPNGIDIPARKRHFKQCAEKNLLFLGRLHPVKGVERLLKAWESVESNFQGWRLQIVGAGESAYVEKVYQWSTTLNRVDWLGPKYGLEKTSIFEQANLYVLPTYSENFGLTVAEALAAGTPVIVTKGAPWPGLKDFQAGWWIEQGTEPLVACLNQAMKLSEGELAEMGERGKQWMQRDFPWSRIAKDMSDVYRWLLSSGERPSCVRVD